MKITRIALAVASIIALYGCGSDSDSAATLTPTDTTFEAQFVDAPVAGLKYDCGEEEGYTDDEGKFTLSQESTCSFFLGGLDLGSVTISETEAMVTPYTISDDEDKAGLIAAIFQSIDSPDDGVISLADFEASGKVLTSALLDTTKTSDEFKANLVEQAGISEADFVSADEALEKLNEYLNEVVANSDVVKEALALAASHADKLDETDLESLLAQLKGTLSSDAESDDAQALLAMIEIAEILNNDTLNQYITLSYVEAPSFNYSETLPKVLDEMINDQSNLALEYTPSGTTQEQADILYAAAERLVAASDKLDAAFDFSGRVMSYDFGEDTLELTYAKAQAVRVVALAAANGFSTAAAYQLGDDTNFVEQEAKVTADLEGESGTYCYSTEDYEGVLPDFCVEEPEYIYGEEEVTAEYQVAQADPKAWIESDSSVFTLRDDPKYLSFALSALKAAVEVALDDKLQAEMIETEELTEEDATELEVQLNALLTHLNASNGATSPWVVEDEETQAALNLQAVYDVTKGIDRNTFNTFAVSYECEPDFLGEVGRYNSDLSKLFNQPVCGNEWEGKDLINTYYVWTDPETGITAVTYNYVYVFEAAWASVEFDTEANVEKLSVVVTDCKVKDEAGEFTGDCEL